ncbi:nuclear transport factor 2 family protein [Pseudonocardia sp. NPDC049635]|uniref:nuclear transport factor 2 family protein n=1 Tax=Pseudonocardia sp. NPDC049635 TaxID=3155506 RepID=UPI0033E9BEBA
MSTTPDARTVAQSYFDALEAGDFEAAISCLSEDIVLTEAESLPYGGIHHGREKFKDALGQAAKLGGSKMTLEHLLVDGERVAALVRLEAPSGSDSPPTYLVDWQLIRDGKIVELTPFYYDTASILAGKGTPPLR